MKTIIALAVLLFVYLWNNAGKNSNYTRTNLLRPCLNMVQDDTRT